MLQNLLSGLVEIFLLCGCATFGSIDGGIWVDESDRKVHVALFFKHVFTYVIHEDVTNGLLHLGLFFHGYALLS